MMTSIKEVIKQRRENSWGTKERLRDGCEDCEKERLRGRKIEKEKEGKSKWESYYD